MSDLLFVWFPVIAAVAAAVFGVFLLFIGSRTYVNAVFLQRDGVAGRATVVRCYKERIIISRQDHSRHVTRYNNLVDYDIYHNGKTYSIKGRLAGLELWDSLSVDADVDVIYLPRNPRNSQLAETFARAGTIGGIIQILAGAALTTAGVSYVCVGLFSAMVTTEHMVPGDNWVNDMGVVLWISKSDDPFVRIMRPNTRQIHFEIGDDEGGREYLGQIDISLAPNEFPELRVGDVMRFLRAPDNKDKAVLVTVE